MTVRDCQRKLLVIRRYVLYALLIVVVVSVALVLLTSKPPVDPRFSAVRGRPAVPRESWKPSADFDVEANADFAVETDRTDNVRSAGKSPGADWPQFGGPKRENKSLE